MPVANCKRCGRIFNKLRREICAQCVQEEEQIISTIRGYLKQHRDATIVQLSEDTEIDYEVIVQLIRDGRLLLHDNPNMTYACERCGKPTSSGRLCADCSKDLAQRFGTASQELKTKSEQIKRDRGGFYSR